MSARFFRRRPAAREPRQPVLMLVIHSLRGGGAERVCADMATRFTAQGWRVVVVTQTDTHDDLYALPAAVTRHALALDGASGGGLRGAWANWRRVRALRRLMRREQPDVVVGMMTTAAVLSVLAAGRRARHQVYCVEHTHPPLQRLSATWQRLRARTYRRAAGVVALTEGTATWLRDALPGVSVDVIPNAIGWPMADAGDALPPPARGRRLRLLAVGRLHPVKGFDVLLQAFADLAPHFPDWDLVILGEGEARADLEAQRDRLGLTERVSLPGRAGNVAQWYAQSDLYVLSSRVEGFSNTLLEAMASGLAVVAFDCDTGPREIIREDIDGVLARPAGDPQALAAHLSDLMAHPERRARLASRAPDVRERFHPARILAMWQACFLRARRRR